MVRFVAVVAVARNGVIGANNGLPWRISSDLKRFKALTMGKPLILGRRTFESLPQDLPGRRIIVITRAPDFSADGVVVARSPGEAVEFAREIAREMSSNEAIIGGGAEIFRALMDRADRIELTEIALEPEGDVFLPKFDAMKWWEIVRESPARGPRDEADCSFVRLERR